MLVPATSPAHAQRPDTLRFPLRWEITEGAEAVAESLGVLSGIAVDRNGNVSDRGATKIWIFDSLGRSQRGIGRKGEGPGEFQSPTGIAIGPDGRLWVRDINRVSRFTLDRATGRLTQYEAGFAGPTMADWMNDRASRFMTDGGMTYPEFGTMYRQQPPPRAGRWFVFGADGALGTRRIAALTTFVDEVGAWNTDANRRRTHINWRFTRKDERRKFKYTANLSMRTET